MILSRRCYLLLAAGGLGAALLDILADRQVSLNFLRIYNFVLLVATVIDASQVKDNTIEVSLEEIQKLSVGRDNPNIKVLKQKISLAKKWLKTTENFS